MGNNNSRRKRNNKWEWTIDTVFAFLAFLVAGIAVFVSIDSNKTSQETKEQMKKDSIAEYQGVFIVNHTEPIKTITEMDCESNRDAVCLFGLLLNDNSDVLDETIDLFFKLEIANPRKSAIFSVNISNKEAGEKFSYENIELFNTNASLSLDGKEEHEFSHLRKELNYQKSLSSLQLVNLISVEDETIFKDGFGKYHYEVKLSNGNKHYLYIELPYINYHFSKIAGEEAVEISIDRGYFDIAFLTAVYSEDETPSVMKIPLHYSYLDYNNNKHEGDIEIIITIKVRRIPTQYNQYEFTIEMEYRDPSKIRVITERIKLDANKNKGNCNVR
jgi:hypothetical protein